MRSDTKEWAEMDDDDYESLARNVGLDHGSWDAARHRRAPAAPSEKEAPSAVARTSGAASAPPARSAA
jgi:hypothetical protein